jgi:uncharacterized protein (TIGR00296 family)
MLDTDGASLVRLARTAVEKYVTEAEIISEPSNYLKKSGVFVTINYLDSSGEGLRGCIGFLSPYKGLHQSVIEAAIAAATEDPRFPPVDRKELDSLIFEVSVLSEPEEINAQILPERRKHVVVGRDGLILKWRHGSGLLLPQVPVEFGWDVDEYLQNICYKAGAPHDTWLDPESRLYRFQAAVFKEDKPRGEVVRLTWHQ